MLEIVKKDNGKENPITISISRVGFDIEIPTLDSVQLLKSSMTYMQSILRHLFKMAIQIFILFEMNSISSFLSGSSFGSTEERAKRKARGEEE